MTLEKFLDSRVPAIAFLDQSPERFLWEVLLEFFEHEVETAGTMFASQGIVGTEHNRRDAQLGMNELDRFFQLSGEIGLVFDRMLKLFLAHQIQIEHQIGGHIRGFVMGRSAAIGSGDHRRGLHAKALCSEQAAGFPAEIDAVGKKRFGAMEGGCLLLCHLRLY